MSYTIQYGKQQPQKKLRNKIKQFFPILALIIAMITGAIFSSTMKQIWYTMEPENKKTAEAFSVMVENLKEGVRFSDASRSFCQEIIYGED